MPALTAGTQFVRLSTARLYELVTRRSLLIYSTTVLQGTTTTTNTSILLGASILSILSSQLNYLQLLVLLNSDKDSEWWLTTALANPPFSCTFIHSSSNRMSGKTFFQHGIPPLGKRSGSKSKGSVSKEKHFDATVIEQTDEDSFGLLPDDLLNRLPATSVWVNYEENGELAWGSESDIQGFVKGVLQAAIRTLGLTGHIKCYNALSIFDLRPDVWLVCADGVQSG